jgi:hypothetical protein
MSTAEIRDMSEYWGNSWDYENPPSLAHLVGKPIEAAYLAEADGNACTVLETAGYLFLLGHSQDCCERFELIDGEDDLAGLIGGVVVVAEEVDSDDIPALEEYEESYTWTLYRFRTTKGDCTLRFYGSSNGYYGEAAELRVFAKTAAAGVWSQ